MSTVDEVKARLDIVEVVWRLHAPAEGGPLLPGAVPVPPGAHAFLLCISGAPELALLRRLRTGGDVIAFVSKKENLDFQGALRLLADRAGVELRSDGPRREQTKTLHGRQRGRGGVLPRPAAEHAARRVHI